jgi:RHS repeat-associated protein
MNHDRTYRPVPYVPAPRLRDANGSMRQAPRRSAGYAATHTVQPLKGLPGTRATDVSYRALDPGGAGFCYRVCTGTSESRLTAHYSLLTANSSYTFSAKEKDVETGLSYFGSRYYSSDLSVWLSVDPMAAKYPSLSPYTYCADNPVKLVDPNGEDYDVFITGDGAEWATKQLSATYQNLNITRDQFGRLHTNVDDVSSLTKDEKLIFDAINSNDVVVNIDMVNSNYIHTEFGDFRLNRSSGFYRHAHSNAIIQPYSKCELRKMFCARFSCNEYIYDRFVEKALRQ